MSVHRLGGSEIRAPKSRNAGFTLIEVVIALVISAIIVLAGRQMLEAIGDESRRVHRASEEATLEANSDRVLRELIGRMEIGSTEATWTQTLPDWIAAYVRSGTPFPMQARRKQW